MLISFVKDGLYKLNNQTITLEDLFVLLKEAMIDDHYFKGCLSSSDGEDLTLYIINIVNAMRLIVRLGYRNLEKYNNLFAFLVFHTLNLFDLLGV